MDPRVCPYGSRPNKDEDCRYPQAELDAKAALALRPEWPKAQSRLLAAQQGRSGLRANLAHSQQDGQEVDNRPQRDMKGLHTGLAQAREDQGPPWHCSHQAGAGLQADGLQREILALELKRDALSAEVARLEAQKAALSTPPLHARRQLVGGRSCAETSSQPGGERCCAHNGAQPGGRGCCANKGAQPGGRGCCVDNGAHPGGEGACANENVQPVGERCCAKPSARCLDVAALEAEAKDCNEVAKQAKREGPPGHRESNWRLEELASMTNCKENHLKQPGIGKIPDEEAAEGQLASQDGQPGIDRVASQISQPASQGSQPGIAGAAEDDEAAGDEEAERGLQMMEEVDRLERLAEEARLSKSRAAALLGPGDLLVGCWGAHLDCKSSNPYLVPR